MTTQYASPEMLLRGDQNCRFSYKHKVGIPTTDSLISPKASFRQGSWISPRAARRAARVGYLVRGMAIFSTLTTPNVAVCV